MTEDMTVRGFTASTQRGYIRAVGDFTAFFAQLEVLSGKSRVKSRYVSTPLRAPVIIAGRFRDQALIGPATKRFPRSADKPSGWSAGSESLAGRIVLLT